MEVVRQLEERSEEKGRRSMVKDAKKYASEFGLKLTLVHPNQSVKESFRQLVGSGRCNSVLRNMQKAVVRLRLQTPFVSSIVLIGL